MQKTLTAAERLIVAADFKPPVTDESKNLEPDRLHEQSRWRREYVRSQVLSLADSLKGTGVYLKVNSALRACGYDLIGEIQLRGLRVFADLKLIDIGETLSVDGVLLKEAKPELLTTMCVSGVVAMKALKAQLPHTEVLGVTVLTSLTEAEIFRMFQCNLDAVVDTLADMGEEAGLDGFVCSPKEAARLRSKISSTRTINTPNIRPAWAIVPGDDQNPKRSMTPAEAIKVGADRIVVGRPIVKAEKPYDAVMRTIEEIASAM
jgi:orotidine-5'-phosphate decarboxylase